MTYTTDITATVDAYLSAWNERDPQRRADLIERVWSQQGRLIDPPLAGEGHAAIGELAADGRLLRVTGFFGDLPARNGR